MGGGEGARDVVLAQIGCGYWGPNLLRSFSSQPGCRVKCVAETRPERQDYVRSMYPGVALTSSWCEAIDDPEVEAVVVATPAGTHYEIARYALRAGKHVLVEKPLATSTAAADELIALADARRRALMAGHTFLYNPAVRCMRDLLQRGEVGEIRYIYSQRLNLGQVRSDVNAWWSLAPHDISILLFLMEGQCPETVALSGAAYLQPGVEDVVFAVLTWKNGVTAHIHASWLDPGKVRRTTVVGSRKMLVYDDVSPDKIAVVDKGVDRVPMLGERMDFDHVSGWELRPRAGEVVLPAVEHAEPLRMEAAHFLECVRTGSSPMTGGRHARDVVAVLEGGAESLKNAGRAVRLAL